MPTIPLSGVLHVSGSTRAGDYLAWGQLATRDARKSGHVERSLEGGTREDESAPNKVMPEQHPKSTAGQGGAHR